METKLENCMGQHRCAVLETVTMMWKRVKVQVYVEDACFFALSWDTTMTSFFVLEGGEGGASE